LYVLRHLLAKAKAEGKTTGLLSICMHDLLSMKHLLLDPNATVLALNNGKHTHMVRNKVVVERVGGREYIWLVIVLTLQNLKFYRVRTQL
jgi:hypothetical protein